MRALRALDDVALAEHYAKERSRDRARKRKMAAKRAAELPALPVGDGDAVWGMPHRAQPYFIGEYVWLMAHQDQAAQIKPAQILQLYRDGSADVELIADRTAVRAFAHQLKQLVRPCPIALKVNQIIIVTFARFCLSLRP